jgi:RimJ/RimL family protein N-acetyltransferase
MRRSGASRERGRPRPWLTTLRLSMREFVRADFDDLRRLNSDARVMKYITGKPESPEETQGAIERTLRNYRLYPDLGAWYATRRDNGEFIGWFSLKYAGKSPDIEIGYRLLPEAWGQGFATEGASAMYQYGFEDLDLDRIIGVTHPDHRASQNVLMKAGLFDCGWGRYYDLRLRLFASDNPYRA